MRISLGTAQFGLNYGISNKSGIVNNKEIKKILNYSKKNNINFIDTASSYGKCHENLGKNDINKFKIVTKLPKVPYFKDSYKIDHWIKNNFEKILKKLKVKKVYGLLLHQPSQILSDSGPAIYSSLLDLKKNKKINKIGISVYSPSELKKILKLYNFEIINIPLSIANQEFIENNYLKKLKKKKIEIHVRSIFLQGLLLMKINEIPNKFKKNAFLNKWNNFIIKNNISSVEACILFVKKFKEINKIIVGIESLNQLRQIIRYYNKKKKISFIKQKNNSNFTNPNNW